MTKNETSVNWPFLLFLMGITYVKLYVKIAALIFYFCFLLYKHYQFKKPILSNWFYFIIVLSGTISSFIQGSFTESEYIGGYFWGITMWGIAFISSYFIYLTAFYTYRETLLNTLKAFFGVNVLVTLVQLIWLVIISKHNPYWYFDSNDYFGGSTGDHLHGSFGNISVTNAMVSAIGTLYFLFQNQLKWASATLIIMLLCTSNLTLILIIAIFVTIFIFTNKREIRKNIAVLILLSLVIYPLLTPENLKYVGYVYDKETSTRPKIVEKIGRKKDLERDEFANAFKTTTPYLQPKNYYKLSLTDTAVYSMRNNLQYAQQLGIMHPKKKTNTQLNPEVLSNLIKKWYGKSPEKTPLATYNGPVKLYTISQTYYYLTSCWAHFIFGAGLGNFSSKQAIKTTGLNLQGNVPAKYIYICPDFMQYHFYTILYIFSQPVSEHSIINMPNSVYNQIAGEYGLIGIILFSLLYIGYFWKNRTKVKGGMYLLILLLLFFGFDYWFEMVSLSVIFETIMLKEIYSKDAA